MKYKTETMMLLTKGSLLISFAILVYICSNLCRHIHLVSISMEYFIRYLRSLLLFWAHLFYDFIFPLELYNNKKAQIGYNPFLCFFIYYSPATYGNKAI